MLEVQCRATSDCSDIPHFFIYQGFLHRPFKRPLTCSTKMTRHHFSSLFLSSGQLQLGIGGGEGKELGVEMRNKRLH